MLKSLTAVLAAAASAALVTFVTMPGGKVAAGALATADAAALHACEQHPWPYLKCLGTRFGDPRVRLVSTQRLPWLRH